MRNDLRILTNLVTVFLFSGLPGAVGAAVLAEWDPTAPSINTSLPFPANAVAPEVTAGDLDSNGLVGGLWFNAYAVDGWPSGFLDSSRYLTVSVTADPGRLLVPGRLDFNIYNNFSGTGRWTLRSSADGFTTSLGGDSFDSIAPSGQPFAADLSQIGPVDGPLELRLYTWNNEGATEPVQRGIRGTGSGGNGLVLLGNLRDPGPMVLTFPGPTPCDLSLQACINSALPGDTIEIATNTPIDESLSIEKSLTLRAASGFSPTIGTGVSGTFRRIDVQTDEENAMNVVIEGLNVDHGQVDAFMFNGDSHNIVLQDLVILNGQDSNNTHGIAVDLRARESHALMQRNRIRSNGQGIRVFGSLPANGLEVYFTNFTLLANEITGFEQPNNNSGIEVDIRGAGEATVLLHSNLIYGMAGCNCGGASGVDISALDFSVVNAFVTNNTIDDSQISSDGLNALARDSATINLSLYNNIISNSTRRGVDVGTTVPTATVNVQNDYNSFWNNNDPNVWNGGAEGPNSGSFDPDYVDSTTADYRPGLLAAVRNIGAPTPPGGLPEIDAKNGLRLVGAGVELGALEDASALSNGSFESDQLPSPTRLGIENVTVWIATGGFSLLERAINGVSQIPAQDGLQFVSMGHDGATGTVLEQAFPTTPGEFYETRFWVRAIQGSAATGQDLEVRVLDSDGSLLNSSTTEVDVFDGWSQHTLVFLASTEQSVIEIEDTGESDTANLALDNVTISPVPEPGVGAALISGGLALLALRRRRQVAVD